jgi:hypothetical protein
VRQHPRGSPAPAAAPGLPTRRRLRAPTRRVLSLRCALSRYLLQLAVVGAVRFRCTPDTAMAGGQNLEPTLFLLKDALLQASSLLGWGSGWRLGGAAPCSCSRAQLGAAGRHEVLLQQGRRLAWVRQIQCRLAHRSQ